MAQRGKVATRVENDHFYRFPENRELLEPLLGWFDITWATVDKGLFGYFVKPISDQVGRFLGVDGKREILLLVSPFSSLEPRNFTALDSFRATAPGRLDPHLEIVVTDDPDAVVVAKRRMAEEPERASIIAYHSAELADVESVDDLYEITKARHFVRDLFALESPLTQDLLFFGRDDLMSDLVTRVLQGQNSGLFGLRRIGKTSVLYGVKRKLHAQQAATAVYIDLSGSSKSRWFNVLERIATILADACGVGKPGRRDLQANSGYLEETATSQFQADVDQCFRSAKPPRILLLLDEVENVSYRVSPSQHWNDDFIPLWGALRAVHQMTQGKFAFIVAGVNPTALETSQIELADNPLFGTTKAFFLPPLDTDEMCGMVRAVARMMGLGVRKEFLEQLDSEFGGHPFMTRKACSMCASVVEGRPAVLERSLFEKIRAELDRSMDGIAEQILTVLATWYPDEYELLELLAEGDHDTFSEFASQIEGSIDHIKGYGLLANDESGRHTIRLSPVERVIRAGRVGRAVPGSPVTDDDWDHVIAEVSVRRNRIEKALRRELRSLLRFEKGTKAMTALLAAVEGKRKEALQMIGYEQAWSGLYFLELASILDKNWGQGTQNLLGGLHKPDVMRYLAHINACRFDAHARDVTQEDLSFLRVCFARFESALGLSDEF